MDNIILFTILFVISVVYIGTFIYYGFQNDDFLKLLKNDLKRAINIFRHEQKAKKHKQTKDK